MIAKYYLRIAIVMLFIVFSSQVQAVSLKEQSVYIASPALCGIICAMSIKEKAFIAYNSGTVCEAKADQACAIAYFSEAYRLLPQHPLIQAKMQAFWSLR